MGDTRLAIAALKRKAMKRAEIEIAQDFPKMTARERLLFNRAFRLGYTRGYQKARYRHQVMPAPG